MILQRSWYGDYLEAEVATKESGTALRFLLHWSRFALDRCPMGRPIDAQKNQLVVSQSMKKGSKKERRKKNENSTPHWVVVECDIFASAFELCGKGGGRGESAFEISTNQLTPPLLVRGVEKSHFIGRPRISVPFMATA